LEDRRHRVCHLSGIRGTPGSSTIPTRGNNLDWELICMTEGLRGLPLRACPLRGLRGMLGSSYNPTRRNYMGWVQVCTGECTREVPLAVFYGYWGMAFL